MSEGLKTIELTVKPVIQHDLLTVGRMVDERLAGLNLANLVATEETIKSMKDLRAELNKEYKEFEEQRKVVKNLIMEPYSEMDEVYKSEVSDKYKNAVDTLKIKVDEFENITKDMKKKEVEDYFNELCIAEKIDFLEYPMLKMDINLSTTVKKYKEQVNEFVQKFKSDCDLISTQDYKNEIMVEFMTDLNVSRAIQVVVSRKIAEIEQAKRLKQQETDRRETQLVRECNMLRREFVKAFVNIVEEAIYVPYEFIHTATNGEWALRIVEIKDAISIQNRKTSPSIIEAPVVVEQAPPVVPPEMLTARFEVSGTMDQLVALNDYLKQNKLSYQNI